ncbi:DUF58 domain-containing protein [Halorussus sp. AFM4]|uniref:DUF58 domain-containing protein n=1 Tax=Halorussus sp. AFM4 TaxID=3421651 RepID=UPI003EBEF7E9
MIRDRVPRFRGALAGTLLLTTLGLLYAEPRLFAAAAVPLAYVAVGALSSLSGATEPWVERRFDPASPAPGEAVEVTLRVENSGDAALADVRVVDGVPDELAVVSGSPRAAVALRAGEAATRSYSVVAKRGDHEFDDPAVRVRTASATDRVTTAVAAGGETTLACARSVADAPFGRASPRRVGTRSTDAGGEGLEFHSTREYRSGDPISRIDWRRFARTGDLTTVNFREERAARTVLVVDARPVARTTPSAGYPNGAALAAYAGERLYDALTAANVATDVAAVGVGDADPPDGLPADGFPWVSADEDAARARLVFEAAARAADLDAPERVRTDGTAGGSDRGPGPTDGSDAGNATSNAGNAATSAATPDGGSSPDPTVRRLLSRLPARAQVVLVSPVTDDWPAALARSLAVRGRDLAVLSPDATGASLDAAAADDSPGRRVAGARRAVRLWDVRTAGATIVDWDVDDPLDIALERSLQTLLRP